MKKISTFFISALLAMSFCASAQNYTYFTEYFDDGATAITGTTANAATTPTPATIKSGTWTTYYSFRAGSGCTPNDPAVTSAKELRILGTSASTPAGLSTNANGPYAYLITPTLPYGVNQVSWKNLSTSTSGATSIYTSTNDGATWTLFQAVPTTAVACDAYTVTINNAAVNKIKFQSETANNQDIDNITITSVNPILPVTFSGISAALVNSSVRVNWEVSTEVNIANYIVERSSNGTGFIAVANTPVNANGVLGAKYTAFDNAPLNGMGYYRVKSVEKDGRISYTSIVRVNTARSQAEVSVAPNPVKSGQLNLQFSSLTKGSYTVNLFNNVGQLVFTSQLSADGGSVSKSFILPSTVKSGVYNLQVTGSDVKLNKRVVVE